MIYGTAQDGREALEHQVRLMFAGSHIYRPSMTIAEVAKHYTATQPGVWARNVAERLGVTVETTLEAVLGMCLVGAPKGIFTKVYKSDVSFERLVTH